MNLSTIDSQQLSLLISEFRRDKDILAVILFGSAKIEESYRDIDIALVKFPDSPRKPMKYLLSFPEIYDIHFLDEMPTLLAKEAIQGKILFNKDYSQLYDIYIQIIQRWESFRPYYELYLEIPKNGL